MEENPATPRSEANPSSAHKARRNRSPDRLLMCSMDVRPDQDCVGLTHRQPDRTSSRLPDRPSELSSARPSVVERTAKAADCPTRSVAASSSACRPHAANFSLPLPTLTALTMVGSARRLPAIRRLSYRAHNHKPSALPWEFTDAVCGALLSMTAARMATWLQSLLRTMLATPMTHGVSTSPVTESERPTRIATAREKRAPARPTRPAVTHHPAAFSRMHPFHCYLASGGMASRAPRSMSRTSRRSTRHLRGKRRSPRSHRGGSACRRPSRRNPGRRGVGGRASKSRRSSKSSCGTWAGSPGSTRPSRSAATARPASRVRAPTFRGTSEPRRDPTSKQDLPRGSANGWVTPKDCAPSLRHHICRASGAKAKAAASYRVRTCIHMKSHCGGLSAPLDRRCQQPSLRMQLHRHATSGTYDRAATPILELTSPHATARQALIHMPEPGQNLHLCLR